MAKEYTTRTLREIVRVIASRFLGMTLIFAIVLVSVAIASLLAPRWYRSEAKIKAQPDWYEPDSKPSTLRDRVSLFMITQREIIKSDYVLASALMRMDPLWGSRYKQGKKYEPWYSDKDVQDYIAAHDKEIRKLRKRIKVETPGGHLYPSFQDHPRLAGTAGKIPRQQPRLPKASSRGCLPPDEVRGRGVPATPGPA